MMPNSIRRLRNASSALFVFWLRRIPCRRPVAIASAEPVSSEPSSKSVVRRKMCLIKSKSVYDRWYKSMALCNGLLSLIQAKGSIVVDVPSYLDICLAH